MTSMAADVFARDSAIAASLALQFGCLVEILRTALSRDAKGRAEGPPGRAAARDYSPKECRFRDRVHRPGRSAHRNPPRGWRARSSSPPRPHEPGIRTRLAVGNSQDRINVIQTRQRRLKVLIEMVLERHHRIPAAIDELVRALDDEVEERVRDRVADLRQQFEQRR